VSGTFFLYIIVTLRLARLAQGIKYILIMVSGTFFSKDNGVRYLFSIHYCNPSTRAARSGNKIYCLSLSKAYVIG